MSNGLNRVTHERIENGIVVSGKIGSAETWADAYRKSVDEWQYDAIIASMLMDQMDQIYDSCETASDLDQYEERLSANRALLATMSRLGVDPKELERLAKYELEIRSREPD